MHAVVPHVPLEVIAEDLRLTRSVEFTLERIIEGNVQIPENAFNENPPITSPIRSRSPVRSNNVDNMRSTTPPEIPKAEFAQSKEERQKILSLRKKMLRDAARKFVFTIAL